MRSRLRKHTHAARYRPPSLKHSALPRIVRRIVAASLFLVVVIVCSTIGFYLAGGGQATFMDAFYMSLITVCLLYTSDAADERSSVDLGGRRIIKKKN